MKSLCVCFLSIYPLSTIFCEWFLILLGLEFCLFESLRSFPEVWDLTNRWKITCDSKMIICISLDLGISVNDYLRTWRNGDRNVREESNFFCKRRREAFLLFHVQDVLRKIHLQVSKVSLTSNLGGENISMIEELSNLVVEVCLYEITQGKTS